MAVAFFLPYVLVSVICVSVYAVYLRGCVRRAEADVARQRALYFIEKDRADNAVRIAAKDLSFTLPGVTTLPAWLSFTCASTRTALDEDVEPTLYDVTIDHLPDNGREGMGTKSGRLPS